MVRRSEGEHGPHGQRQLYTPGASPLRREVERRSAPLLLALGQAPRWLLPMLPVALLLGGLAAPPWAGVPALVTLGIVLGWLAYLSWPALGGPGRVLRVVALLALTGLTVLRLLGQI